jgi:hypothetical protein
MGPGGQVAAENVLEQDILDGITDQRVVALEKTTTGLGKRKRQGQDEIPRASKMTVPAQI